jgi:hypothetical protein
MRRLFAIVVLFLVWSCTRTAPQAPLVGNWRLVQMWGGYSATDMYHIPADSPVILTFNADLTFQIHAKNLLVSSGAYRVIDTSLYGSTALPVIVFGPRNYQQYQLNFLSLVVGVGDEAWDGIQSTYIRTN